MTYLDYILEFALDIFHSSGCRDRMVIGFIATYMQSVPVTVSPLSLQVRIPIRRGAHYTTLSDKVCQSIAAGLEFSPTP